MALRTPDGSVNLTWRQYADHVRRIAGGLAALGLGRGDTFAQMLTNRPEFNLTEGRGLAPRRDHLLDLQHQFGGSDQVSPGPRGYQDHGDRAQVRRQDQRFRRSAGAPAGGRGR
nr:AMP-binding protein [Amycolatopsis anabasis]